MGIDSDRLEKAQEEHIQLVDQLNSAREEAERAHSRTRKRKWWGEIQRLEREVAVSVQRLTDMRNGDA